MRGRLGKDTLTLRLIWRRHGRRNLFCHFHDPAGGHILEHLHNAAGADDFDGGRSFRAEVPEAFLVWVTLLSR